MKHDLAHDLLHALPPDRAHVELLRRRLADEAERVGVLDVAYRTIDTAVGSLLLAATSEGLVRVAYAVERHDDVLQSLADRISPRILHAPHRLDEVAAQLDEYFDGTRHRFDVTLDMRLASGFRRTVLQLLTTDVGYGHRATYADLARIAGNPKAVRAVGTACATNPIPVVVPCHRVVRSDGAIGNYLGGSEAKRTLLELEAAA